MEEKSQQSYDSDSRCPQVDLNWMISLEDQRKAFRRGSFISTEDVPRRSIVEDNMIVDVLRSQGFTIGLARTLIKNTDSFPARIWLIDNSATMNAADGHRIVHSAGLDNNTRNMAKISNTACTRWEEVCATLMWHASFCAKMGAPTAIRLAHPPSMRHPQQLGIASAVQIDECVELSRLAEMLHHHQQLGGGGGPLSHLSEIVHCCLKAVPELVDHNKSLAILYVTDRLPVDDDGREGDRATQKFLDTIYLLQGTPIYVVIRLSTDEKRVVDFYNDLDRKMNTVTLEFNKSDHAKDLQQCPHGANIYLDVLDDFISEANAVHEHNPWLNYAYPLHLCRESCVRFPVFDALNDRPLTVDELVEFLTLLFDRNHNAWALQPLPNPQTHYMEFRAEIMDLNRKAGVLYDPIKCRMAPWIDLHQMDRLYSGSATAGCSLCVVL